jgi:hypothetical protein
MTTLAYILLGLLGVVALVAVVWRGASRRRSLPCPTWLSRLVELDNPFTETNRAAVIVERLELQPGMAVLDVGCGPGRVAIPIASRAGGRSRGGRYSTRDAAAGAGESAGRKGHEHSIPRSRNTEKLSR